MNAILEYAIENQSQAKAIISGRYGLVGDSVEEVNQQILVKIWQADPEDIGYARAYWGKAVRTITLDFLKKEMRCSGKFPLQISDPRQNLERQVLCVEQLKEIWRLISPRQRRALLEYLYGASPHPNGIKARIWQLRKRLRERGLNWEMAA